MRCADEVSRLTIRVRGMGYAEKVDDNRSIDVVA